MVIYNIDSESIHPAISSVDGQMRVHSLTILTIVHIAYIAQELITTQRTFSTPSTQLSITRVNRTMSQKSINAGVANSSDVTVLPRTGFMHHFGLLNVPYEFSYTFSYTFSKPQTQEKKGGSRGKLVHP